MVKITIEIRSDNRERKSVTTVKPEAEEVEMLAAILARLEGKSKKAKSKKRK